MKGKKIDGESEPPHHAAIQEAVIQVEPAKPARPSAAGGAIGRRKIVTLGWLSTTLATFSLSWLSTDIVRKLRLDKDSSGVTFSLNLKNKRAVALQLSEVFQ